jgi:hypothetical protein
MKMKEIWFQLPVSGYVQRVGFYAFLIHPSTLSEVVFCNTSAYLSPSTRVYVRGKIRSDRIFGFLPCDLVRLHRFLKRYL